MKEIDPKNLTQEELLEAYYEMEDKYITLESTHLDFVKQVVEFTVLAAPFLVDAIKRKEIHGEGSILKLQTSLIELNMRLDDLK